MTENSYYERVVCQSPSLSPDDYEVSPAPDISPASAYTLQDDVEETQEGLSFGGVPVRVTRVAPFLRQSLRPTADGRGTVFRCPRHRCQHVFRVHPMPRKGESTVRSESASQDSDVETSSHLPSSGQDTSATQKLATTEALSPEATLTEQSFRFALAKPLSFRARRGESAGERTRAAFNTKSSTVHLSFPSRTASKAVTGITASGRIRQERECDEKTMSNAEEFVEMRKKKKKQKSKEAEKGTGTDASDVALGVKHGNSDRVDEALAASLKDSSSSDGGKIVATSPSIAKPPSVVESDQKSEVTATLAPAQPDDAGAQAPQSPAPSQAPSDHTTSSPSLQPSVPTSPNSPSQTSSPTDQVVPNKAEISLQDSIPSRAPPQAESPPPSQTLPSTVASSTPSEESLAIPQRRPQTEQLSTIGSLPPVRKEKEQVNLPPPPPQQPVPAPEASEGQQTVATKKESLDDKLTSYDARYDTADLQQLPPQVTALIVEQTNSLLQSSPSLPGSLKARSIAVPELYDDAVSDNDQSLVTVAPDTSARDFGPYSRCPGSLDPTSRDGVQFGGDARASIGVQRKTMPGSLSLASRKGDRVEANRIPQKESLPVGQLMCNKHATQQKTTQPSVDETCTKDTAWKNREKFRGRTMEEIRNRNLQDQKRRDAPVSKMTPQDSFQRPAAARTFQQNQHPHQSLHQRKVIMFPVPPNARPVQIKPSQRSPRGDGMSANNWMSPSTVDVLSFILFVLVLAAAALGLIILRLKTYTPSYSPNRRELCKLL